MTLRSTRRDFLKTTAAAGLGFWAAGGVTLQAKPPGPNDRINVGLVGVGGRGRAHVNSLAGKENIVALCDVDDVTAGSTYRKLWRTPRYSDFRAMLDRERTIDAVVVATPDHMHAPVAIRAMRMGKHCYCEKPLTHNIYEARLMKEVARENRVATQMGNQGTSSPQLRRAVEIVRAGALGDVREVHIWTNRPIWPQNRERPTERPAVPASLDWRLWLGCAPQRPYHSSYVPFAWRGWWDFGTGALGDMGCHTMNMPFMALRLGLPTSVVAELDTPLNSESPPLGCKVTYEFPARNNLPAVTMYWYERRRPAEALFHGQRISESGSLLVGTQGTMYSASDYGESIRLLPANQFENFRDPEPSLPRSPGHMQEWLNAIRGGTPAMSNFVDYSALLTEVVLLGNVAIRCNGQRVRWDAERMRATDLAAADAFIRREYRAGWEL